MARFRRPSVKITRDSFLFVFGLVGITYETLHGGAGNHDALIILFGSMSVSPIFIRTDEQRRREAPPPPPAAPAPAPPPDGEPS